MGENIFSLALKKIFDNRLFLCTLVDFLRLSDVLLTIYWRKRFYVGFENCFTAFAVLFEALRWGFCVNWMNCCQDTGENVSSPALKPVIQHSPFFFEYFGSVFASIGCYYEDTGENVSSPSMKPVLRHSPFFFENFSGYFALLKLTVAKIRAKTFFRRILNRFNGIHHSFLSTLVVFLPRWEVLLPGYKERISKLAIKQILRHSPFSLKTYVMFLRQSDVPFSR